MRFSEMILERIGPKVQVPQPILAFFRWVDANDLGRTYKTGQPYALIDPALEHSCVGLVPPDPDHAAAWTGVDIAEVSARLVPFCKTGGDGSYAAFWVDDDGETQIVHLGSGSGSTMIGVMVDDPVDFLRLLAIGYDELCWPEIYDLTPQEHFEEENPEDDFQGLEFARPDPPQPPMALRNWVTQCFDVQIPAHASDIVAEMPDMIDENSNDPFCVWLCEIGSGS